MSNAKNLENLITENNKKKEIDDFKELSLEINNDNSMLENFCKSLAKNFSNSNFIFSICSGKKLSSEL